MLNILLETLASKILFFALHLNSTGSFPPPLSAEEEHNCLLACASGDISARDRLIEHNLRLVVHVIKKYYANCMDQDDLISVGTIGLIKAINTFNVGNLTFQKSLHAKALSYLGFIIQHVLFECKQNFFGLLGLRTSFPPRRRAV